MRQKNLNQHGFIFSICNSQVDWWIKVTLGITRLQNSNLIIPPSGFNAIPLNKLNKDNRGRQRNKVPSYKKFPMALIVVWCIYISCLASGALQVVISRRLAYRGLESGSIGIISTT